MKHLESRLSDISRKSWLRALRALLTFSTYIGLLVLLPGCGDRQTSRTIQIGINDFPTHELLYLAQEKGFYREEGVDVKIVEFSSLGDSAIAFRNKQLDGVATTLVELVHANANASGSMKAVWALDYSTGADAILARENISTIDALKGRRGGLEISSVSLLLLGRGLQRAGLTLDDVTLIEMDPLQSESALQKKEIDAIVSYSPYVDRLLKKSGIRKILDSSIFPTEILDILAFQKDFIEAHPDAIKSILRAYRKSILYFLDHQEEAITLMARRERTDPSEFRNALNKDIHILSAKEQALYFSPEGLMEQKIAMTINFLRQSGQLEKFIAPRQLLFYPELP